MVDELRKEKECLHDDEEFEEFGEGKYNKARKIVWDLLEKPQTSKTANVSIVIPVLVFVTRLWEKHRKVTSSTVHTRVLVGLFIR